MDLQQLAELQGRLEGSLRNLASSQGRVEDVALPELKALLPHIFNPDQQPGRAADLTTKLVVHAIFRKLCLDLAEEAQHKGQPPMQYVAGRATEPSMQRLLAIALLCSSHELIDAGNVISLLDDLQEVCTIDHCLDIITWLEQQTPVLASGRFTSNAAAMNQLTRLCNGILKRLGQHEVVSKARLLILIASITPLFDRSGVGVTGAFAPPDPPKAEDVPADAVDSTGKPVDVLLYKTFWSLQSMLQDPISVLNSMDKWGSFKKDLSLVLDNLGKSPATVAAARTAAAAAGSSSQADTQEEGAGTQCYLSSYKLFGLQLTDSTFRRDFLVQVLVMLRTLLIPGRVPAESLKPKQRMEALALEKEVYKVLEATPRNGKEFCRAVREVLEREITWVIWKKGGKDFVVLGKDLEASQAPAAAAGKKAGPATNNCIDWSKPPHDSLAQAVDQARAEAAAKQEQQKKNFVEGLALKRDIEQVGRQYDNMGEPMEVSDLKKRRYLRLLEKGSSITFWAQAQVADRSLAERPLLAGLKRAEQPQYPTPQAVCAQVLREMDPEAGIELSYRRVADDNVYRWRLGRIVAQAMPEHDGVDAAKIEEAVIKLLPDQVPETVKKQKAEEAEKAKADKAAAAAGARDSKGSSEACKAAGPKQGVRVKVEDAETSDAAGAAKPAGSDGGAAKSEGADEGEAPAASDAAAAADSEQGPADTAAEEGEEASAGEEGEEGEAPDGAAGMEVDAAE